MMVMNMAVDMNTSCNYTNIDVAIGDFEHLLQTPSRFDDFLNGDEDALNMSKKRRLKKIYQYGLRHLSQYIKAIHQWSDAH